MKAVELRDRLIVAADFKPESGGDSASIYRDIVGLARAIKKTGVPIKVNSALRCIGYDLIGHLHQLETRVFADLKLCDIEATLQIDGEILNRIRPYMVTAMCSAGVSGLYALKEALPETEVVGVTVLTSLHEKDMRKMYRATIAEQVESYATMAVEAGLDGVVGAPGDIELLRNSIAREMTINTPGVRPHWNVVENDDQNWERVMTPAQAIKLGATRIIVGRPITQSAKPYDAVMRTLEEIERALA